MPSYRAYRLDERRRILTAEWIEAPNDEAATAEAKDGLCEEGVPLVEVWQATRLVDEVACDEDDEAA